MSDSTAWNARYGATPGMFGWAPNEFLTEQAHRLRPGMQALAPGDGEGATASGWARQGLEVTALDWSATGMAHAAELAAREGVALTTVVADATAWDWPEAAFDLVAWIFVHLPPEDRAKACAGVRRALKPGGAAGAGMFFPPRRKAGAAAARVRRRCCGPARSWRRNSRLRGAGAAGRRRQAG